MAKAKAKAAPVAPQDDYLQILRDMQGDPEGRAAAEDFLQTAYAYTDDPNIRWASNPLILGSEDYATLELISSKMGSIMEKVMAKYHRDRTFRALFELPREIEDLTLVPSGCHAAVPLSRIDVFLDRSTNTYKVTGIVTGGVWGMAASGNLNRALHNMDAYRTFVGRHTVETIPDPVKECARTILHTYGKWANAGEGRNHPTNPSLAVVDVKGSPRAIESRVIIERLRELGCYARATDFSQLRTETVGGIPQLVDNHGPITCVWLRATIDEAIANLDSGMRVLADATRHGMVCTVGGYRSWPCCTRSFLSVLHSKQGRALLTYEENAFVREHVPVVHVLNPAIGLSDFYDQESWVLRTSDGHAPGSVVDGDFVRKADWRKMLVKGIKRRDAVQRQIDKLPLTIVATDDEGSYAEADMNAMLGLFVFESKLCGVEASCSTGASYAGWSDYLEMGCLVVRD